MSHQDHHHYLQRARSWCAARVRGEDLDQVIAEGLAPESTATDLALLPCQARARLLVSPRFRFALGVEIDDLLAHAAVAGTALRRPASVWTVDIRVDQVRAAAEKLRLLADRLQAPSTPRAQGVALAVRLMRDGRSPLYSSHAAGELELAVELAARALTAPVDAGRVRSFRNPDADRLRSSR